jgi:MFS transporter, DHA1 family, inner membrane transport protein
VSVGDSEEFGVVSSRARPHPLASARRRIAGTAALAVLGASAFCYATGENLPVGLLPLISASLHSSLSAAGLLVTVYALVVVGASVPLTYLTRHISRRYLLSGLLGVFAVGTLGSATAPSYGWLLASRVVTGLSQALFWAIAPVAAAALFPPHQRGRAIAGVLAGGPLALVLGLPAGTWAGQQAGWRVPFLILSGLGLAGAAAVVWLVPVTKPGQGHASVGTRPDPRCYWMLVAATVLAVAGTFTAYTYVSAFLTTVSRLPAHQVPPVLLLNGLASAAGVGGTGMLISRHPRAAALGPLGLLAVSMLGLSYFGTVAPAAVAMQALETFSVTSVAISMQTLVLIVAPRSTDIASAWYSSSYNAGIAIGPVIGGLVLSSLGLRGTPLVGGLMATAALMVVLVAADVRDGLNGDQRRNA